MTLRTQIRKDDFAIAALQQGRTGRLLLEQAVKDGVPIYRNSELKSSGLYSNGTVELALSQEKSNQIQKDLETGQYNRNEPDFGTLAHEFAHHSQFMNNAHPASFWETIKKEIKGELLIERLLEEADAYAIQAVVLSEIVISGAPIVKDIAEMELMLICLKKIDDDYLPQYLSKKSDLTDHDRIRIAQAAFFDYFESYGRDSISQHIESYTLPERIRPIIDLIRSISKPNEINPLEIFNRKKSSIGIIPGCDINYLNALDNEQLLDTIQTALKRNNVSFYIPSYQSQQNFTV